MSDHTVQAAVNVVGTSAATDATGLRGTPKSGTASPAAGSSLPRESLDGAQLEALVHKLNKAIAGSGHKIRFQVDLDRGYAVIQVLDSETGAVIRSIPQEKASLFLGREAATRLTLLDERI